jgi:hypothetical protein
MPNTETKADMAKIAENPKKTFVAIPNRINHHPSRSGTFRSATLRADVGATPPGPIV